MRVRSHTPLTARAVFPPAWLLRAFLFFCLICAGHPTGLVLAEPVLPARASAPATPLLPYLDYFLDENGDMDIEEAAAPDHAAQYRPLALRSLPNASGVMWLRFTLGALPEGVRAQTMLLDMGESIPGVPILYEPLNNAALGTMEWREVRPSRRNLLLLPEAGPAPLTCYLRLDGLPGIWFSPTLRTPQDAADNWGGLSRLGAILALGVVMLLCVMRAFAERGQWRIWTALYVGAALAQALAGMPETGSGHVNMRQAAAIMLPGIALMLLPHVGRHLMGTAGRSRSIDIQLLLLSLPGAALALMPIIPSWLWLARWLDLWPAGTLFFVPTALAAWISGAPGSRRFLLGCLLPPLAVGAAIAGLDLGWAANMLASLPLWGVALSALVLATGTSATPAAAREESEKAHTALPAIEEPLAEPIINLESPLAPTAATDALDMPENGMESETAHGNPAIREAAGVVQRPGAAAETFNLQKLLRRLHDDAASRAEARGIGLAWYMPPQLDQCYRGDGHGLSATLEALLENALSATKCGSIHLSVRRVPESGDPGNLLFTVSDSGRGMEGRSAQALARACAMAGEAGGYVGMECGPNGATVAFTSRLGCLDGLQSPPGEPLVIVLGETSSMTRTLAHMLRNMPCRVRQAADFSEALDIQKSDPAILLIVEGAVASAAAGPEVRRFAELAHRAHLPLCKRLAITPDQSQWTALGKAGFTHALEEPVDDESLRVTVAAILEKMREMQEEDARQASADHQPMPDTSPGGNDSSGHDAASVGSVEPGEAQGAPQSSVQEQEAADPDSRGLETKSTEAATAHLSEPLEAGSDRKAGNEQADQSFAQSIDSLPWPEQTALGESSGEPRLPEFAQAPQDTAIAAPPDQPLSEGQAMRDTPAGQGAAESAAFPVAAERQAPDHHGLEQSDPGLPPAQDSGKSDQNMTAPPREESEVEALPAPDGRQWLPEVAATQQPAPAVIGPAEAGLQQVADITAPAGDNAGSQLLDTQNESGVSASSVRVSPGGEQRAGAECPAGAGSQGSMSEGRPNFMDLALAPTQPAADGPGHPVAEPVAQAPEPPVQSTRNTPPASKTPAQPQRVERGASAVNAESRPGRKPVNAQPRPGGSLPYVSHHLGQPGEWVGEPMPIGTPISRESTHEPAAARADAGVGARQNDPVESNGKPLRSRLAYESPSIPQPGEWVGEPMPVGTPVKGHDEQPGSDRLQGVAGESGGNDTADVTLSKNQAFNDKDNFLDFIAQPAPASGGRAAGTAPDERQAQGSDVPEKKAYAPIQALVTRLAETVMHVTARQERERSAREAARKAAPQTDTAAQAQDSPDRQPATKPAQVVPADPALAGLVLSLDGAMADADRAFRAGNPAPVAQEASFIAARSEEFGLRVLARMARCVEQAARARDMGALGDLLPELASAVERNRIALSRKEN